MSKRSLIILSFLFVFTFGGAVSDLSSLGAKTESKTEQSKNRKKNKKGTKKKKSKRNKSKRNKTSGKKKKSSKKKKRSGKKYSKKKGKRYSGKKKKRGSRNKKKRSNTTYNSGTYTAPKTTFDLNGTNDNSSREYKRSSEPTESFKKEPKKESDK